MAKKSYKSSDTVLTVDSKISGVFTVTPQTFGLTDFTGCTVTGERYYISKAVKLGAKRKKTVKGD